MDVLSALRWIEARRAIESAHKIKQLCGQVFRFAVASGLADRDITTDLRGAVSAVPEADYAALTEPDQAAKVMGSIDAYDGHASPSRLHTSCSFGNVAARFAGFWTETPGYPDVVEK